MKKIPKRICKTHFLQLFWKRKYEPINSFEYIKVDITQYEKHLFWLKCCLHSHRFQTYGNEKNSILPTTHFKNLPYTIRNLSFHPLLPIKQADHKFSTKKKSSPLSPLVRKTRLKSHFYSFLTSPISKKRPSTTFYLP